MLKEKHKKLWELKKTGLFTPKGISAILGITRNTYKTYLKEIKKILESKD